MSSTELLSLVEQYREAHGLPSPTWPPASSARPRPAALPLPDPPLHPIASIVR